MSGNKRKRKQEANTPSSHKPLGTVLIAAAVVWVAFRIPEPAAEKTSKWQAPQASAAVTEKQSTRRIRPAGPQAARGQTGVGTNRKSTLPQTRKEHRMFPQSTKRRAVEHASEADFTSKVLKSNVPVLVDFYADWCGPCRMLAPVLEDAASELTGAKIVKVNVDENPNLAGRYGVRAIPTMLIFRNGQAVAQHVGLATKEQIKQFLR